MAKDRFLSYLDQRFTIGERPHPFLVYPTLVKGRVDSSFYDASLIEHEGENVVFLTMSADGKAIVMDPSARDFFLASGCWIQPLNDKRRGFWQLNDYLGYDLVVRDVTREKRHFYGAKLYLLRGGKQLL